MSDWQSQAEAALADFAEVARLAAAPLQAGELRREFLNAPHRSSSLPSGSMAVYGFWGDGCWLKIGKVGPGSNARFQSQHYTCSAPSTLAGSLCADARMRTVAGFNPDDAGAWIKASAHRMNLFLPASKGDALLSLLESFLQIRLKPRYEGRADVGG